MKNNSEIIRVNGELVDGAVQPYDPMAAAGQAANHAAAKNIFGKYRERKARSTVVSQDRALQHFAQFLGDAGVTGVDAVELATDPTSWQFVTWGLVEGFSEWLLQQGYSTSTVNNRLSAVRTYCKMAHKAGVLDTGEYKRIEAVKGLSRKEAARLDENREQRGRPTRVSTKKEEPVTLTVEQVQLLLQQPTDTPQGRRDRLMMHLFLVHGLRVSEIAQLQVGDIILTRNAQGAVVAGLLDFFRVKMAGTDEERGKHILKNGTLAAAVEYLENDALATGPLFRSSRKGGALVGAGMTARRLSARVRVLGERVGVDGLTAHDCRHYAATAQAPKGVRHLMDQFGWTSPSTAMRYVEPTTVVEVE